MNTMGSYFAHRGAFINLLKLLTSAANSLRLGHLK
jgi:hypothetical protein